MPDFRLVSLFVALWSVFPRPLDEAKAAEAIAPLPNSNAIETIRAEDLQKHVNVLASDTFEGREAGTRGGRAAGAYIVDELRKLNVRPSGGGNGYYQWFGNGMRNILVTIEGNDPRLKSECIVVGAHYDHVGFGDRSNSFGPIGYIHNGADDNASGVSGLLEMIEALGAGQPLRRSVLFAFWDGEEKGLLGSKHWVTHPTVPLSQVVFTLNTDMIGRLDESAEVLGVRTTRGLRSLVARHNREAVTLRFNRDIVGDSDHHPFVERRIPYLMFFTGKHKDYHRPSDDVGKVNAEGMQSIVRVLFRLLTTLGNAEERLTFRPECRLENEIARKTASSARRASRPSRLGLAYVPRQDGSAFVSSVRFDSAARQAGIRAGDRLLRFNDVPLANVDLRELVEVAPEEVEVVLVRQGTNNPVTLNLRLGGTPSEFGMDWYADPVEPDCIVVERVFTRSIAERLGLKTNDRIYAVDNAPAGDPTEFRDLMRATLAGGHSFIIRIEREGIMRDLQVDVRARTSQ